MANGCQTLLNFLQTFSFLFEYFFTISFVPFFILTIISVYFLVYHHLNCFHKKNLKRNIFCWKQKTSWSMSAISETYKCYHNILKLFGILITFSFTQVKQNVFISNKNGNTSCFRKIVYTSCLRTFRMTYDLLGSFRKI